MFSHRIITAAVVVVVCGAVTFHSCTNEHYRPIGHQDITLDVSPQGDQIVFNASGDGGRDLYTMDLKTRRVARLAATPEYEVDPAYSPDGKSIVYAAGVPDDRADHLFVRSLAGGEPVQLTSEDANDSWPRFSPDGALILFARDKTYAWGGLAANWGGDEVLCLMRADGRNLRQITADGDAVIARGFSADGQSIHYRKDGAVYSMTVDDPPQTEKLWDDEQPYGAYSPDGSLVASARGRYSPDHEIYVSDANGESAKQITQIEGQGCFRPLFMPDGKTIIFLRESWPDGGAGVPKYSVWQVDVDGKRLKELADFGLFDDPLTWKPKKPSRK